MCKKDWRLLQAYKATGLTPEQVALVKQERDALIDDLKKSPQVCAYCMHVRTSENRLVCASPIKCDGRSQFEYIPPFFSIPDVPAPVVFGGLALDRPAYIACNYCTYRYPSHECSICTRKYANITKGASNDGKIDNPE